MSSETFGSCQNFDVILDKNCFLTSLPARDCRLIMKATMDLRNFLFGEDFEIRRKQATRWRSVDTQQFGLWFHSNIYCNTFKTKSYETMQKSIKDFCAILGLYYMYLGYLFVGKRFL